MKFRRINRTIRKCFLIENSRSRNFRHPIRKEIRIPLFNFGLRSESRDQRRSSCRPRVSSRCFWCIRRWSRPVISLVIRPFDQGSASWSSNYFPRWMDRYRSSRRSIEERERVGSTHGSFFFLFYFIFPPRRSGWKRLTHSRVIVIS